MTENEGCCSSCSSILVTTSWNSVTNVSFCDNSNCQKFHTPVKRIGIKEPLADGETRLPDWITTKNTIVDRVRRLREKFLYGDGEE